MTNKPLRLTRSEIDEISASEDVQEICGAENAKHMQEILEGACTVKFHFVNESPGYVGDLFLIQSACLSTEIPVVRLIRNHRAPLTATCVHGGNANRILILQ